MDNPSFMLTALYERQKEIGDLMNGNKAPGDATGQECGAEQLGAESSPVRAAGRGTGARLGEEGEGEEKR